VPAASMVDESAVKAPVHKPVGAKGHK